MKKKILILIVSLALLVGVISGCVEEEKPAENEKPMASFDCVSAAYMGDTITFTSTSTDEDGEIASYSWMLGEDEVSTESTFEKTFDEIGTYTITLTVTDDDDTESDTVTCEITIGYTPPTVAITVPETVTNNTVATFTATVTAGDGTVGDEDYAWHVDGEVQADMNTSEFTYTFTTEGEHTIKVMVTDSNGETGEDTQTVTVEAEATE